jgi:hypothetical protein
MRERKSGKKNPKKKAKKATKKSKTKKSKKQQKQFPETLTTTNPKRPHSRLYLPKTVPTQRCFIFSPK